VGAIAAFIPIAIVIVITPGPDMALVTRNALAGGRGAALRTAGGIMAGVLVWAVASVLGLAAVLATSTVAFTIVKWLGAAYLVYLGVRTLLRLRSSAHEDRPEAAGPRSADSPFRQGFLSNVLNPKVAVLFTSLIPQFVTPGPWAAAESVLFAGIFAAIGLAWLTAYSFIATAVAGTLRQPRVRAVVNAITGTIMVALGLRLVLEPSR